MRLFAILLICPLLTGCLAFGYPDISQTPVIVIPVLDVRAFLVTTDLTMYGPCFGGGHQFGASVKEIPVINDTVASQRDAYFAYHYLVFPILNGSRSRTQEVLLYRPGYETVTIPARPWWQGSGIFGREKVAWKKATDLVAQKAALEKVASPHHFSFDLAQEVIIFAAQEYARLGDSPLGAAPEMAETRKELLKLAQAFKGQILKFSEEEKRIPEQPSKHQPYLRVHGGLEP